MSKLNKLEYKRLITVETLIEDFQKLGVEPGMTVLLHSSLNSLGSWVVGGPVAVIHALERILDESGTLVMPTQCGEMSDPAGWRNPPVPEAWWETIRQTMPPYEPDMSPCPSMGLIPETFRKQHGALRSSHPQLSFAARGKHAEYIIGAQSLDYGLGERSPLARIYELGGSVLLLGVGHGNNTSLHLAEYRANYAAKQVVTNGAPMMVDGRRAWVEYQDIDTDTDDFEAIGEAFAAGGGQVRAGKVAEADALLLPQAELVDFAAGWMTRHRR